MPERHKSKSHVARGRKLLAAGAVVQTIGLAIVGTSSAWLGSWIVLGGWICLVYGLHAFGRGSTDIESMPSDHGVAPTTTPDA